MEFYRIDFNTQNNFNSEKMPLDSSNLEEEEEEEKEEPSFFKQIEQ